MLKKVYSSNSLSKVNYNAKVIDIIVEFNEFNDFNYALVAAVKLKDPTTAVENLLPPDMKKAYEDFLTNVEQIIEDDYGFKIVNRRQSGRSYAYYIEFLAPGTIAGEFDVWKVRIRIADHVEKGGTSFNFNLKYKTFFRSITIGDGLEFNSYIEAIVAINRIVEGIANNDFDALNVRYESKL